MAPSFDEQLEEARARVRQVSPAQAKAMVEAEPGALIIDVREPHEWEMGHISGAVLVPLGQLAQRADAASATADPVLTGRSQNLVVAQCQTGKRSILAADLLQKLGYTNVVSMQGGFLFWARSGFPID